MGEAAAQLLLESRKMSAHEGDGAKEIPDDAVAHHVGPVKAYRNRLAVTVNHHRYHVAGAQIDAQPQRRLAGGGRPLHRAAAFAVSAKASVVRRAPCSSLIRFETHPPARSGADERRCARWSPLPGWGGDGHGGPALAAQPKPSDARSILTKMLVSMAFAIWFMLSMLRECIAAVWWQPPSSCTAGRWPLQRSPPAPPAAPASSVQ